jgi:hypothetical protein
MSKKVEDVEKKFKLNKDVFFYHIKRMQNTANKDTNYYDYQRYVVDYISKRYYDATPDERTLMMKNVVVSEHFAKALRYSNSYFEKWLYEKLEEIGALDVKTLEPAGNTYVIQSSKYFFLIYQHQLGRFQVYGFSKKVFELVDDELEEEEEIVLDKLL